MKKYLILFEHLYSEISTVPSCSVFGCTNCFERNKDI